MRIGIAFDLKSDFVASGPEDALEEYDSTATIEAIVGALRELGHEAQPIGGGRRFVERMLAAPPDLVFNIAEGAAGSRSREAHVPAVCEMLKVPCTHSDPLTLALTLDKAMAKRMTAACGVSTPSFQLIERITDLDEIELDYPLMVKPTFEGSSMGIRRHSRVTDRAGLEREVRRIVDDYKQPALVEEFCSGPEFTVGILGEGRESRVIGVMEIVPKRARPTEFVYSLEVKRDWENEVEYHVPPKRDARIVDEVAECALAAHRALGCRDVSRVDVRLDSHGEACFLEVNPLPGLNPKTGDLCILAAKGGLPYSGLIDAIVRGAMLRHGLK